MALAVISTADAERLFAVMRDTAFGWTVAELPELLQILGWTISTEVPEAGAVVRTPWGLPDGSGYVQYWDGGTVAHIEARATGAVEEGGRLDLADAFATLAWTGRRVLGPTTSATPGQRPSVRWRLESATVHVSCTPARVLFDWKRNDLQDLEDLAE